MLPLQFIQFHLVIEFSRFSPEPNSKLCPILPRFPRSLCTEFWSCWISREGPHFSSGPFPSIRPHPLYNPHALELWPWPEEPGFSVCLLGGGSCSLITNNFPKPLLPAKSSRLTSPRCGWRTVSGEKRWCAWLQIPMLSIFPRSPISGYWPDVTQRDWTETEHSREPALSLPPKQSDLADLLNQPPIC